MTVPWWAASIMANVSIMFVEYLNRAGGFASFFDAIKVTAPLIFVAQIGLFYAWRDAPSLMFAWAFFTVGNTLLRLVNTTYLAGEPLGWTTLAGVSVMFGGACLIKAGS